MATRELKTAVRHVLRVAARAYGHVRRNRSVMARRALGVGFVVGGFLAVLPVFGLWMLPVGLALLSDDVPQLRRLRRRLHARILAWASDRKRRPRMLKPLPERQPRSGPAANETPTGGSAPSCPGRPD